MTKTIRPSQPFRSTFTAIAVGVNGLVAFATVFSAFGGCFDPTDTPIAALAAMVLPVMLLAGLALIIADMFINPRLALMIAASWLISIKPLLIFFPLNTSSAGDTPADSTFTLLTYNVMHYVDYDPEAGSPVNRSVSYILETDADVVNLQEAEYMGRSAWSGITQEQYDSIRARYPYRVIDQGRQLSVFSKYPVRQLDLTIPRLSYPCLISAFQLDIHGTPVTLYNVHLKSIGLSDDDKELYREISSSIPKGEDQLREDIREVKSKLVSKLASSFATRVLEARWLRQCIDSIGGNTIVAGDFNDIPGCYAERVIMNGDLHDAYAENAFGARITYHDNRFYFRIDHVLYGGSLQAVGIRRDTPQSSDHYPMLTTFRITDK